MPAVSLTPQDFGVGNKLIHLCLAMAYRVVGAQRCLSIATGYKCSQLVGMLAAVVHGLNLRHAPFACDSYRAARLYGIVDV